MRIGELAQRLNITPHTVRYYTNMGLLSPVQRRVKGYKAYGARDQRRLRFIVDARQLGFSVDEIGQILDVSDNEHTACPTIRQLIEQRLADSEQQFLQVLELRARMHAVINDWRIQKKREPTGRMVCYLIDGFRGMPAKEK